MNLVGEIRLASLVAYLTCCRPSDAIFAAHGVTADPFDLSAKVSEAVALVVTRPAIRLRSDGRCVRKVPRSCDADPSGGGGTGLFEIPAKVR